MASDYPGIYATSAEVLSMLRSDGVNALIRIGTGPGDNLTPTQFGERGREVERQLTARLAVVYASEDYTSDNTDPLYGEAWIPVADTVDVNILEIVSEHLWAYAIWDYVLQQSGGQIPPGIVSYYKGANELMDKILAGTIRLNVARSGTGVSPVKCDYPQPIVTHIRREPCGSDADTDGLNY